MLREEQRLRVLRGVFEPKEGNSRDMETLQMMNFMKQ
jgi:hypothetical protein